MLTQSVFFALVKCIDIWSVKILQQHSLRSLCFPFDAVPAVVMLWSSSTCTARSNARHCLPAVSRTVGSEPYQLLQSVSVTKIVKIELFKLHMHCI